MDLSAAFPAARYAYPGAPRDFQITDQDYWAAEVDGVWVVACNTLLPNPPVPPLTLTHLPPVSEYERVLDAHLDAVAAERRYSSRVTCALRAGYPGPFQAEGAAFAQWMDACNATAYRLLADVGAGRRPCPTPAELIAELPPMEWPPAVDFGG